MEREICLPIAQCDLRGLSCGDTVRLSGVLYTARDAAHKRICEMMDAGEAPPFEIKGAVIYYVGPTPAGPGRCIGSAGPTTSYRMDAYTPRFLRAGLAGMIGKGRRSAQVAEAMAQSGAVYFGAIGGAGALLAACVRSCEPIAFHDLGAEAVHRLTVKDFPVTVLTDREGRSLYERGPAEYLSSLDKNK